MSHHQIFSFKYRSALVAFLFTACALGGAWVGNSVSAQRKTKMDKPTIACGGSTQASINITVTAGDTGAPAGFSLQWLTADQLALGADGLAGTADDGLWFNVCAGSFSGNASLSRYNLTAGQSVSVNVGEFLFDNGASTNCANALVCGTSYVFRAFVHASNTLNRSDFTNPITCATLACGEVTGECTYTQGYWKTHGPTGCVTGNNTNTWPVSSLTLGNVNYTDLELCSILNTPASGNGLIALSHQLIAAKLNLAKGSDGTDVAQCMAEADALIGNLRVPPVGSWICNKGVCTGDYLSGSATSGLTTCLANFNEGATGPGHCQ